MPKQQAISRIRDAMMKKHMARAVPGQDGGGRAFGSPSGADRAALPLVRAEGRPSADGPETMLGGYFLQNWYALSDPMAEETLYDGEARWRFAGIELGDGRIPDETTILNFRHQLERRGLTHAIFAEVNAHLFDRGIGVRSGTLANTTIIEGKPATCAFRVIKSLISGSDWTILM